MLINHTASTVQVRHDIAGIIFPSCALTGSPMSLGAIQMCTGYRELVLAVSVEFHSLL